MPADLHFKLLGNVSITLGETTITPMRSRSAEALLIYVALHKKTFSRQVLADFFWDERSQTQALSNLRTVLAMLRRQLPDHLLITRHTVAFNHHTPHTFDITPFQSPLPNSQSLSSNLHSPPPYRGDFLPGFSLPHSHGFEAWALIMREQLRQNAAALLHRHLEQHLGRGDYQVAMAHARRLLQLNSLDDLAHRRLLELLWRNGQRSAALQHYDDARRLLAQELGVAPDAATTALFERLRDAPFPPPARIPAPLTPIVGREDELARLCALLDDPQARLITILGPGGMGKTRLLVEAVRHSARARPGRFIDGVIFVPLAGLPSAEFLPVALAQHLDLTLQGPGAPFTQLLDYLRPRELLLAMDNVEQLLTPHNRRWLAQIAREAPAVRLMFSSRARLALQGERLLQLEGLAPKPAARLFTVRAVALQPSFVPDENDQVAITRLCRLVDGMPLALELAAAGIRTHACRDIVAQVQARLDWQFDHFPDLPRRHQNLRAVFEHSWRQLSDAEQNVARRLSVFAGPFNAAGAKAVADAAPAHLAALHDQSLLAVEQPGWFDLHPLVRRFLAQKLQLDTAQAHAAARRHADYILQLRTVRGRGINMESHYQELQQLMERQHNEVIAAALWLARRRDFSARKLVTLVETLIFYYIHGDQFESWKVTVRQLLQALAQGEGEEQNSAWLAAVLRSRIAEANLALHAYDRAHAQFTELLPRALALENEALISFCHHKLGQLAARRADFAAAYQHLAAALPPLDNAQLPPQYRFPVYRTWTAVALVAGDLTRAHECAEKAYALALQVDSQLEAEPIYRWALGEIALAEGNLDRAVEQLQCALRLAREKGYWGDQVRAAIALATTLAALSQRAQTVPLAGNPELSGATDLANSAYEMALRRHDRRLMALAARARAYVAGAQGDEDAANSHFRHCRDLLTAIGDAGELARTP